MTLPEPWTEEWEEATATAPPSRLIYYTMEFQHQRFAAPMRMVQNFDGIADTMDFGIEDTAIFNPGETVAFSPVAFRADRAEFAVGRMPECTITIDNVARLLMEPLLDAITVQANLTAIYREYVSDDLTAPAYGPVEFVISNVKAKGLSISGTARIDNLSSKKFPSRVYTLNEFPSLLPG
jgi:hypothetical protein